MSRNKNVSESDFVNDLSGNAKRVLFFGSVCGKRKVTMKVVNPEQPFNT
ncbi:hypothetical protein BH11BAC1_BH11BAC1_12400 [soil metagenome]